MLFHEYDSALTNGSERFVKRDAIENNDSAHLVPFLPRLFADPSAAGGTPFGPADDISGLDKVLTGHTEQY